MRALFFPGREVDQSDDGINRRPALLRPHCARSLLVRSGEAAMKSTVLIAAACAVLAGCTTAPPAGVRRQQPTTDDYTAYVTVVHGKIFVYPEAIVVRKKNVKIYWFLDKDLGYQFTTDGIVIDDPHGHGEFTNCKSAQPGEHLDGGYTYRCHDKNDKSHPDNHPRTYKYTIKLQGKSGPPIDVDPMVVND
jgi:hypothetical protein